MAITLYELCGRDMQRRISPHCWKVRMALEHKGLPYETRAIAFTEIAGIGNGFSPTVPVIDDGGRLIRDSFDIAVYLEEAYPDLPSLFAGNGGIALARFIESWALTAIHPLIQSLIIKDIHDALDRPDQVYFRESREKRLGRTLEEVQARREERRGTLRQALQPLRHMLSKQPFIGGETSLFADYVAFGPLQWARIVTPFAILTLDDPVVKWFERCLDLHEGAGRSIPAAA